MLWNHIWSVHGHYCSYLSSLQIMDIPIINTCSCKSATISTLLAGGWGLGGYQSESESSGRDEGFSHEV